MFAVYAKSCEKEYFARLDRFESVLIGSGFNATLNVEGSEAVHAQVTLGSQPLLECRAAKGMFCWPTNVQDAHAVESEAVRLPCATQIPLRAGARFKIGSLVFRVVLLSLQGTNAPGSYNPRDLVCIDAALEMTRNSDKCASDDWVGDSKSKFVFLRTRAQHASSNEIEVSIGRKAGQRRTDITVNAPQVSGKHCRVRWQRRCDNTRVFEVNDMNSRNGTTLVSSDQSEKRVLPQTWQVAPKASLIRLGKASVLLRPLEVLVEVEGSLSAMKEHASQYVSVITKPAEARVKLSAFDRIPSLMTDDAVTDALLRSDTPPDTLESLFGVTEVATKPLPKIAAKPSPKTDVVEVVEVVEASSFQSPRKSPRKQSQPTSSKSPPQQSMFNPRENLNASARTSAVKPEVEYVARTGLFGDCCLVLATESRRGDLLLVIYEQRGGTIVSDLETLGKWKGQQIILYDPEARKWRFTLDKSDTRKKPVEWVAACIKQGRTTTVTKSPKLKAEKKKLQVPSPKKSAAEVVELSFNVETDPNNRKPELGMLRRVEKLLPNGFQLSPRSCFFVGDSAGRVCADGETNNGVITRNDTSCCDLLFAKNANLHFLEAERYFASKSTREQMAETRWYDGFPDEHDEDYDDDDYASLEEHVRSFSGLNPARLLESNDWRTLPDVIPDSTSQQCVIMCGMPGSGKSHFARLLVERRNFTRVCRDETASMSLVEQDLVTALKKGHSVVVDNTCPTESDRARWRQIARATCPDVDVLCVFLRTSVEVAWHLNCFRARRNGCRKLVPPEAFLGFRRRFESPVSTSGMPVITLETPVGPLHIAESEKSDFRLRSEMPKQLRNLIRVRAAPLRAQSYETVTSEERRKRAFYNKH
ncbi:MAG: hypothetical protein MHM6MM_000356 [Cercozoa sp. M6MM]